MEDRALCKYEQIYYSHFVCNQFKIKYLKKKPFSRFKNLSLRKLPLIVPHLSNKEIYAHTTSVHQSTNATDNVFKCIISFFCYLPAYALKSHFFFKNIFLKYKLVRLSCIMHMVSFLFWLKKNLAFSFQCR